MIRKAGTGTQTYKVVIRGSGSTRDFYDLLQNIREQSSVVIFVRRNGGVQPVTFVNARFKTYQTFDNYLYKISIGMDDNYEGAEDFANIMETRIITDRVNLVRRCDTAFGQCKSVF